MIFNKYSVLISIKFYVVCRRLMSYLRYLCLFAHSGVLILCFCFAFRRLVHPMLSVIVVLVCGHFE